MDIQMREFDAKIQKWGNSYGIRIPKEVMESEKLKEKKVVRFMIRSAPQSMKGWFGKFKHLKLSGQQVKDEIRRDEARE